MEFTNKLFLPLVFVLLQLFTVLSAPVKEKRTYVPKGDILRNFYFLKPSNWGNDVYAYVYTDTYEVEAWPGCKLEKEDYENFDNVYYTAIKEMLYNNANVIFTDGVHQSPAKMQKGFSLRSPFSVYTGEGFVGYKRYIDNNDYMKNFRYSLYSYIEYVPEFENPDDFGKKDVYIHYKIGGRDWTELPGQKMNLITYEDGSIHYISTLIFYENEDDATFVFTDGNDHWDNNNGKNYHYRSIEIPDDVIIESKVTFN